jgi:hypothetical protein
MGFEPVVGPVNLLGYGGVLRRNQVVTLDLEHFERCLG